MKFLCLSCDEGMQLARTSGPHDGSLEATFVCPRCRHAIVMLTNPWETQLVQTLGVKVGGRVAPTRPYEHILGNLEGPAGDVDGPGDVAAEGSGCPFAGMLGQAEPEGSAAGVHWTEAAQVRIERIPSFIRPMVQRAIERYAIEQGHQLITDAIMDEARVRLGM
jgi:hypothetical protein